MTFKMVPDVALIFITAGLFCSTVIDAAPDFTCFNHNPLLDPNGHDDAFIGGYKNGSYTSAFVDFSRAFDTRNGNGLTLPTGSSQRDHGLEGVSARLLDMPTAGGKERIGVFYCEGTLNGVTHTIPTIVLHSNGDPISNQRTITAHIGDTVVLEIETLSNDFYWQKDGGQQDMWHNQKFVTISSVSISDAGIYECNIGGYRADGEQAIIRLIIKECPATKWDPPLCDKICPVCYNGGACDDISGTCICAPGFSGSQCETLFGRNRFGQLGLLRCIGTDPNALPGCQGRLFCLPDPYGCSCGAGFKGRDCNAECDPGTFGADCKQTCHCASGNSICELDTGRCTSGGCVNGWSGENCQDATVTQLSISTQTATTLTVTWSSLVTPDYFLVQYQLVDEDQCYNTPGQRTHVYSGAGTSASVIGLKPYSSYTIYVASVDVVCEASESSVIAITGETVPTSAPPNIRLSSQTTTSLTFEWDDLPCGSRGGAVIYKYSLDSTSGTTTSTSVTVNGLVPCTGYQFTVKASTSAGDGPEKFITAATDDEVPGAVTSLTVSEVSSQPGSLNVSWEAPYPPCTDEYLIQYQPISLDQCDDAIRPRVDYGISHGTSVTVNGLQAYSSYNVFVAASNQQGSRENNGQGTTDITLPTAAPITIAFTATATSLAFTWDEIPCGRRGGPITYKYNFDSTPGITGSRSVGFTDLTPCSTYQFSVKGSTDTGDGPDATIYATSEETIPESPSNLYLLSKGLHDITVGWEEPLTILCTITKYSVTMRTSHKPYDDDFIPRSEPEEEVRVLGDILQHTFCSLSPTTEYEFQVFAHTEAGSGGLISSLHTTSPADTHELGVPLQDLVPLASNSTSLTLEIPQLTGNESMYSTDFRIMVEVKTTSAYEQVYAKQSSYIAGIIDKSEVKSQSIIFIVGSGFTQENPPLEEGFGYNIYVGKCSFIRMDGNCVWSTPVLHESEGNNLVFVSSSGDPGLYTAPLRNTTAFTFTKVSVTPSIVADSTRGISFDPVDGKIYWVEKASSGKVRRAKLDGSYEEDVATGVKNGRGITLDIEHRVVYWCEHGDMSIHKRQMDLSLPASVVPNTYDAGAGMPHDVVYGTITGFLYIAYNKGYVKKISIDGHTVELLDSGLGETVAIDVDEEAGELFYQDFVNGIDTIRKHDLNTGKKTTVFTGAKGGGRGIAIYKDLLYVTDKPNSLIYAVSKNGEGQTSEIDITSSFSGDGGTDLQDIFIVRGA